MLAGQASDDRREKNEVDKRRIELRSASLADDPNRVVDTASLSVAPAVRHGVERVGNRHDPRLQRNARSAEPAGISGSVPSLVVRQHALGKLGIERIERRQHVGAATRVRVDRAPVGRAQRLVIMHDVEERFVDLADVVKERDALDGVAAALVESCRFGDDQRVGRHAPNMLSSFGVIGFDRVEQRLEAGGGETFDGLASCALADEKDGARRRQTREWGQGREISWAKRTHKLAS